MDYIKNLDGEIWCDIEGYPKYQISNKGRVKSLKRPNARLLTAFTNNCGYERVALTNAEGQSKRVLVSRLVAIAFCEKPNEESNTVDHIDTNKTNNNAENLRWMTSAENTRTYFQRRKREKENVLNGKNVADP